MKNIWQGSEVAIALKAEIPFLHDLSITGFSINSQTIEAGNIFLPLKGQHKDGHEFIPAVFDKKAVASLCEKRFLESYKQYPIIPSDNILQDIKTLAQYRRTTIKQKNPHTPAIIGVTGSVGKTSVKEIIATLLAGLYPNHYYKSPANQNNQLGVPLSIINTPADISMAVYEAGMNHQGELLDIGKTLRPDIGVVCNIRENHIGHFHNIAAIAHAKSELLQCLDSHGTAIIEKHNHYDFFQLLKNACGTKHIISFGDIMTCDDKDTDIILLSAEPNDKGQNITARFFGKEIHYHLPLLGRHQVINSLIALATLKPKNIAPEQVIQFFANCHAPMGRGAILTIPLKGGQCYIWDDSYNASPASMSASLSSFIQHHHRQNPARKIAIVGDMLELGDDAPLYHDQIAKELADSNLAVMAVGPLMMQAVKQYIAPDRLLHSAERIDDILPLLTEMVMPEDFLFLKASHSIGLEKIIKQLQGKP